MGGGGDENKGFNIMFSEFIFFCFYSYINMNINASLIDSILNNKKTFGMFYELMLQNEIERILEKMYPAELAGLRLQRNAEYDSCDLVKQV